MKLGTKSLLFGAHQFVLHPLYLSKAWTRLYGHPRKKGWAYRLRLYTAFVVHDWGYWGKPNMDGPEGQLHPELGGRIMGFLFDWPRQLEMYFPVENDFGVRVSIKSVTPNTTWRDFTAHHSRLFAKIEGAEVSPLCAADKLATALVPRWLYWFLCKASGEIKEYIPMGEAHLGHELTEWEWVDFVQNHFYQVATKMAAEYPQCRGQL